VGSGESGDVSVGTSSVGAAVEVGVGVRVGTPLAAVGRGVTEHVGVKVRDGVPVMVGVRVRDGVPVMVGVRVRDGVPVMVGVGVLVIVGEPVRVGVAVPHRVGVMAGRSVGVAGATLGDGNGQSVGEGNGESGGVASGEVGGVGSGELNSAALNTAAGRSSSGAAAAAGSSIPMPASKIASGSASLPTGLAVHVGVTWYSRGELCSAAPAAGRIDSTAGRDGSDSTRPLDGGLPNSGWCGRPGAAQPAMSRPLTLTIKSILGFMRVAPFSAAGAAACGV
jgi:hypothetical protein